MVHLIVAIKRDKRAQTPEDWTQSLREIEGIEILGDPASHRVQIEIPNDSAELVEAVHEAVGELCHVEEAIPHKHC